GHIVMRHRILLHRAAFHGVALRWLLGHGEQRHRETKRTKSTDCNKFLIHETNLPFGFSKPPEAGSAGQTEMRWSRGSYGGPPGFSARMHLLVCKNFGNDEYPGKNRRAKADGDIPFLSKRQGNHAPAGGTAVAQPPAVPDNPERGRRQDCRQGTQCVAYRIG